MSDDIRIKRSQKKIYHALGELMREKSFDKITVSDIIEEAGISRKTFYNHYQDKIDLVQEYQKDLSDTIQQLFAENTDMGTVLVEKLAILLNNQDYLLTALISYNGSLEMQSIMRGTMEKYCKCMLKPLIKDSLQLEYQAAVSASSIFAIVQHWLITGKKIPPKELAMVVMNLKGIQNFSEQ